MFIGRSGSLSFWRADLAVLLEGASRYISGRITAFYLCAQVTTLYLGRINHVIFGQESPRYIWTRVTTLYSDKSHHVIFGQESPRYMREGKSSNRRLDIANSLGFGFRPFLRRNSLTGSISPAARLGGWGEI